MNTACRDCPIRQQKRGCGFEANGQPCQHPAYRDEWRRNQQKETTDDRTTGNDDRVP